MDTDHAFSLLSLRPSLKKNLVRTSIKVRRSQQQTSDFFTAPVHNYIAGKACWRGAVCRDEFSEAELRQQESSQPIADAEIKH